MRAVKFTKINIAGAYLIELDLVSDDRGFFARTFCKNEFEAMNLESDITQSNLCYNKYKGTIRGLHYQVTPYQEVKIARCVQGAVFDVIVDIRRESPSYLQYYATELSAQNHMSVYVPKGCAHGYQTLEDDSDLFYLTTEFYNSESESCVRWNDPAFNIPWPLAANMISDKDSSSADWEK